MVGFEMIQTIGNATATYKFTPKYVLKAGQKVMVRVWRVLWLVALTRVFTCVTQSVVSHLTSQLNVCCAAFYPPTLEYYIVTTNDSHVCRV